MNFPVYLTNFVGRKTELEELKMLLRAKSARLITLTGPGGTGKTRFAHETISRFGDSYEDGVAWVELSGLTDPDTVSQTFAASLNVRPAPGQNIHEVLVNFLHDRDMLVVLDNCEHLQASCAQLADSLLRACRNLQLVATSRDTLRLKGEHLWPVTGLSVPEDPQTSPDTLGKLEEFDAVRLFAERARRFRPTFEINEENAAALVRICQLMEGMPLAIELAASWINVLGLDQMVARLENQLTFPTERMGESDGRHHSMQETIRWSYDLLSEAERTLFHRLGVFCGGFSLEAANTICSEIPLSEEIILSLLGRLIEKSLVVRERSRTGITRYHQLESIRQFAHEKLVETGEESTLRSRHLDFFSNLLRDAAPHLLGPEQVLWTQRLDADHENLVAALSLVHQQAAETGERTYIQHTARMANRLYWLWDNTNRLEAGRSWYRKVLVLSGLDTLSPEFVDLVRHKAILAWLQGDYPAAQKGLEESLKAAEWIDYSYGIGHANMLLSIMNLHQGRLQGVVEVLLDSEQRFDTLGKVRELGIARTNLGGAYFRLGDLEPARRFAEAAVRSARARQDLWGLGLALSGYGNVLFSQGEAERAFEIMNEAIEMLERADQRWLLAEALYRLAEMHQTQGELDRAEELFDRCFHLAKDIGALQWQLEALESLGIIALGRGRHGEAAGYFNEVLRLTPNNEFEGRQLQAIAGLARVAAHQAQWEAAVTLWAAAHELKALYDLPAYPEDETTLDLLGEIIDAPASKPWIEAGNIMTIDEAAALARETAAWLMEPEEPEFKAESLTVLSDHELRLLALGPTEVYLKGRQLVATDWTFAKPKELLFYLASNTAQTKAQIGLAFWPEVSPDQLRTRLRAALYHLRRALGSRDWVQYENSQYAFNRQKSCWYDLDAFETGLEQGEKLLNSDPMGAKARFEEALQLYRGDFLTGLAVDTWGMLRREELRQRYLASMRVLGKLYLEGREIDRAVELFQRLTEAEPLLEAGHRGLIRAYMQAGEKGQALNQYHRLQKLLDEELGVEPSSETNTLYQSIRA